MLGHSVKSSIAHEECMTTRLHLPHAIVMRLDVHFINIAIPTLETMCLSNSLSLPVGFSIQDEAMDVARFAPQGAHYHADVIYLLP